MTRPPANRGFRLETKTPYLTAFQTMTQQLNDDTPTIQASGLRDKMPYLIAFPRADATFLNVQPGHCWVDEGSSGCIRSQGPEMTG